VTAWVLVRSGARIVALPVGAVAEVLALGPAMAAPGVAAAIRGVVPVRGRLLPVAHLGTLLGGGAPPLAPAATGVVVEIAGRRFVLEVDAADDVVTAPVEALPRGWQGRWATTVVRRAGALIPVVDVEWLADRLAQPMEAIAP
jgi:chemotaxis signal transduction protein